GRSGELPVRAALLAAGARVPSLGNSHSFEPSFGCGSRIRARARRRRPGSTRRRAGATARPQVAVLAAARTEPRAGLPAQWLHRKPQDHGLANLFIDREHLAIMEVNPLVFLVHDAGAHHVGVLYLSTEHLEVQIESLGKIVEAAATLLLGREMHLPPY